MNMPPTCEAPRFPDAGNGGPSCGKQAVWSVFDKTDCRRTLCCGGCMPGVVSKLEGHTIVLSPATDYSRKPDESVDHEFKASIEASIKRTDEIRREVNEKFARAWGANSH